jgi:hypothetical protein
LGAGAEVRRERTFLGYSCDNSLTKF